MQRFATARARDFAPLTVVVLDAGGHLIAFDRDDGAGFARSDIAFRTAWARSGLASEYGSWSSARSCYDGVQFSVDVPFPSGTAGLARDGLRGRNPS